MTQIKKEVYFTKDNIDLIFKEFAKQYRKNCRNLPVEIVIVGGASILINYDFRESTTDFDIDCKMPLGFKDAIQQTAEILNLPNDWMNTDFKFLSSYSPKLSEISKPYKILNNGNLSIRTVKGEYLIATKIQSGREFGNDIPDIIGILYSEKMNGHYISFDEIYKAGQFLYGDKFNFTKSLEERIKKFCNLSVEELQLEYKERVQLSKKIKTILKNENPIIMGKESAKKLAQIIEERLEREEY